jgi:hypothetical protein
VKTGRPAVIGALVGLVGLGAVALTGGADPSRALAAYLAALACVTATALGALAMLLIADVTRASWMVVMRRPFEAMAATLPALFVLAAPLAAGLVWVYPWASDRSQLGDRAFWFEPWFVVARGALVFAVWCWLAVMRRRDPARSAAGLIVLFFTATLAAFDGLMSLDPAWSSTVFGVYWLTGGVRSALALAAIALASFWRRDLARLGPSHFHVVGKLLLTAVIFWAYLAYVQGLIIWIADIPLEASWLVVRTRGLAGTMLAETVVIGFVLPFAFLLSRDLKRRPGRLAAVAALVVIGHALDSWWLVVPARDTQPRWLDLAAFAGIGGTAFAVAALSLRGVAPMPLEDPRLELSARYVTT